MWRFDRLLIAVPVLILLLIAVTDGLLLRRSPEMRQQLVDANRIEQRILQGDVPPAEEFPTVTGITVYDGDADFFRQESEYLIREIGGTMYRIDYREQTDTRPQETIILVDAAMLVLLAVIMGVLIWVRQNILKQFTKLGDVPYQLAKGNLSAPLQENKSRLFGKMVWGLDMLRGELERSKADELERAKQEKTMLLSLSHDIKTPLAAIKLYAKGLSRGLFEGEKQTEAADSISARADEIEQYLGEIIRNLHHDFMRFDVQKTDFYLSQIMTRIIAYYTDKLTVAGTEFDVGAYADCMLSGDPDRLEEVLQNILENAIKYGNGRRIAVSFSDEEDCRLITVANTGCTLPDEEIAHIFDSFWRGSNAGSKPGSGLGLYICTRLMAEMGGDIFAETKNGEMRVTVVCKKCS